jgi:hypothetical protein
LRLVKSRKCGAAASKSEAYTRRPSPHPGFFGKFFGKKEILSLRTSM